MNAKNMVSAMLVLFLCFHASAFSQQKSVRFLYFNDAHELDRVKTDIGGIGGVSRMKTVIDSIKQKDPCAVVLFGGDLGGGTLGGKLYHGSVMVESLNQFPVDYANFGQHDFDYGIDNTNKLIKSSSFKWFTSNVVHTDNSRLENTLPFVSYVSNGVRVGIIGLTDKMDTTRPWSKVKQLDLFESASQAIEGLGDVDVLVAVTQMDMKLNEELLKRLPEINIVFTEETSQHRSEVQFLANSVIIAGCGNMGRLDDVVWSDGRVAGVFSHAIDFSVSPSRKLESYVKGKQDESAKVLDEFVGAIDKMYYGSKEATGRLVADAYRDYYETEMSLMHGGGLRSTFEDSRITKRELYSVLPFGNLVIPQKLTGAEFAEMVRIAYLLDGFASVSGAEVVNVKDRGAVVLYKGKELEPDQMYTVSIPDFIASGGGDFEAVVARWLCDYGHLRTDEYIVSEYVKKINLQ